MSAHDRLRRLEVVYHAVAAHRQPLYSDAEWAVMRSRLSPWERAEYDALASTPSMADAEVERGAVLAERMKGIA